MEIEGGGYVLSGCIRLFLRVLSDVFVGAFIDSSQIHRLKHQIHRKTTINNFNCFLIIPIIIAELHNRSYLCRAM